MSMFKEFIVDTESDQSESDGDVMITKRKSPNKKVWQQEMTFNSAKEAEIFIERENIWKKITSYTGAEGLKVSFRCTYGKYRKNECPAGKYLLYHSDCMKVTLFKTEDDHANHADNSRGLSSSEKMLVRQFYSDGIKKPNAIIAAFRSRNEQPPVKSQLKTFLTSLRLKTLGSSTISAGELQNWCSINSTVPINEDQPYVLDFKIEVDDIDSQNQDLKIVLSSKRLLQILTTTKKIQTDATYKLIWQGFPVLIVGTSDICRVFHPLVVAVSYSETEIDFAFIFNAMKKSCLKLYGTIWEPNVLLADASFAITNGFKAVFGKPARRLQCFFHVLKNIESKIRNIKERNEIIRDIHALQVSIDDETFTVGVHLFLKKWNDNAGNANSNQTIKEFLKYFEKTWLGEHQFWYEGACDEFPSTNNGLESTNSVIKKEHTLRERLPVGQFLEVLRISLVEKWSYERNPENPNSKLFASTVKLGTKIWTDAYQWVKLKPKLFEEKEEENTVFYTKSTNDTEILTQEDIQIWKDNNLKWECFNSFCKFQKIIKISYFSQNHISRCTCSIFLKQYICKHSLGILVILKQAKVPIEAKSVPFGVKRKRGRPTKAKKALIIQ